MEKSKLLDTDGFQHEAMNMGMNSYPAKPGKDGWPTMKNGDSTDATGKTDKLP